MMVGVDITVTHPAVAVPAAIAAALVAFQVIWKRGIQPLARLIHNANDLVDQSRDLLAATPVLLDIKREFYSNDGHTLRDAIDRIEGAVDLAALQVTTWVTDRSAVLERLAVLEARVVLLEGPAPGEPGPSSHE